MFRKSLLRRVVTLVVFAPAIATAAAVGESDCPTVTELAKLAEQMAPSCVVVELTVQSDKGETPGSEWGGFLGASEGFAAQAAYGNWSRLINEERPAELPAYLLSDGRVVVADPLLHPRFIKRIAVRAGDELVDAEIEAYGRDRNVLFLRPKKPLDNCRPLLFDPTKPGPYRLVTFFNDEGTWKISAAQVKDADAATVTIAPGQSAKACYVSPGLYVDKAGTAVALVVQQYLDLDQDWRQSPDDWPVISAADMSTLLGRIEDIASNGLVRVNLRLRSPRAQADHSPFGADFGLLGEGPGNDATEWNGAGVLVNETSVLVLANLRPKTTARLETIRVHTAGGQDVTAEFAGTLADYGAFLARLEQPLPHAVELEARPVKDFADELLLKVQLQVLGESRSAYFWRERVTSFNVGWRRQIYPRVSAVSDRDSGMLDEAGAPAINFLFTRDGKLLGIPVARREKIVGSDRWSRWMSYGSDSYLVAAEYMSAVLAGGERCVDAENRPLTQDEENRLAWLGVELQAMTPDLARMSRVADQTGNGATGAIVTYVYPDSPASAAGLEVGDILLRLHVEGEPKPMEVNLEDDSRFGDVMSRLQSMDDDPPFELDDRLPTPWGSAENSLTRALTDVGFGTRFTAEIFRDGKVITGDFVVTAGPAYYASAKRFKSKAAGFTVRDLTYEVRRYFHMDHDDPGVIVSKVERGSRAAIAEMRPFELILSVDDQPIHDVAGFEKAIAGGGEFRLNVKRMAASRVVTIKIKPESEAE